jgi:methylamine dehydrogenase accessory protein MauD
MTTFLLIAVAAAWGVVVFLGFLLLGALRSVALLSWRLDHLEATMPKRIGRDGLKVGHRAPDFTLPAAAGQAVSLHDFAGRKVLLVFVQAGCSPCRAIVPELSRLAGRDDVQVLVVNNGDHEATRQWAAEVRVCFPVLMQEGIDLSRRYQVFATPFAFLIDENGVIASKGLINTKRHLGFVLAGVPGEEKNDRVASENARARRVESESSSVTSSTAKVVIHD